MVTGIIVTHGRLAAELMETAKKIYGNFDRCHSVSNSSKSQQALYDELKSIIDSEPTSSFLVLVDFFGGSCSQACLRAEHEHDNVHVISGVNLPMLLAFLNKRDEVPFSELPGEVLERARSSIRLLDSETL